MRGIIATGDVDPRRLVEAARDVTPMEGSDLVSGVTCETPFDWQPGQGTLDEFSPDPGAPRQARRSRSRPTTTG